MDPAHLDGVPLFEGLSRRQRKAVAQHADEIDLGAGATLAEEGRLANELYVIVSGAADVFVHGESVGGVGPGDVIGEIGVLETHKRTASVVATTPVHVIVITAAELRAMASSYPDVDARLRELIAQRRH